MFLALTKAAPPWPLWLKFVLHSVTAALSSVLACSVPFIDFADLLVRTERLEEKDAVAVVGRELEHRYNRYPLFAPVRAGLCSATLTGALPRTLAVLEVGSPSRDH